MEADNALEAYAAISVGVAGFSAIVVALAANTVIYEPRRLTWALGLIFGWALGAMMFSVLPFIFHSFGMAEALIWRIGLLVMGMFTAFVGGLALSGDRRLNRMGVNIRGKLHDTAVRRSREMSVAKYIYILTAITLIASGVWHAIPGYYLIGMSVMLMLSLWVLLYVFFVIGFRTGK